MKRNVLKTNSALLLLSLAAMLISSVGAAMVQTSAGAVSIKNMSWETPSGKTMSALLLVPDGASITDKRPAVVVAHGWWNNKEMQDANYVELARRGYVVLSIDMYGHGSSSNMVVGHEVDAATGMYDAVKEIASLPYVDTSKIGISGHSNGARAANWAIPLDDAATTRLIKSVYLVDNDPIYRDAKGNFINYYGNRDVGLHADQYDEFFFRSYDNARVATTAPRDYINTPQAQSFLNFGAAQTGEKRASYHAYTQNIDGRPAIREINNASETHPWGPVSKQEVASLLAFFNASLGTPNPIDTGSQIWQFKEFFNAIGLIGFAMFLVAFTKSLIGTRAFAGLRVTQPLALAPRDRRGLAWFWGTLALSAIISGVSYILLSQNTSVTKIAFLGSPPLIPQGAVWFIGLWAAINGITTLIMMFVSYRLFGKKAGMSLRELGVLPGWKKFGQSILLAGTVVAAAYEVVFLMSFLFKTDFRLWVLAIPAFSADKLWDALLVVGYFAIYFVLNSIAINAFNRFTIGGKEWGNIAVLALFNGLAPIILVIAQYTNFFATGELIRGFGGIFSIWLFPVVVILPVAAILSRSIYRATNSPYVGGFIMAAVVTLIAVSNTLTYTY